MAIAKMDSKKIKYVTIHCAATPEGRNNSAEEVRQWDIDRFGQPSYHYVLELDGTLHQHLQHNQRGAHVGGNNTSNLGVCYVGGTATLSAGGQPKDTRTPQQKATLENLLRKLIVQYPKIKIRGHRDWPNTKKACPSFDVKGYLHDIGLEKYFG